MAKKQITQSHNDERSLFQRIRDQVEQAGSDIALADAGIDRLQEALAGLTSPPPFDEEQARARINAAKAFDQVHGTAKAPLVEMEVKAERDSMAVGLQSAVGERERLSSDIAAKQAEKDELIAVQKELKALHTQTCLDYANARTDAAMARQKAAIMEVIEATTELAALAKLAGVDQPIPYSIMSSGLHIPRISCYGVTIEVPGDADRGETNWEVFVHENELRQMAATKVEEMTR